MALENHPDKVGGDDSKTKEINGAWDILKDDELWGSYDQELQLHPLCQMANQLNQLSKAYDEKLFKLNLVLLSNQLQR